jgi:hypothetical protein
VDEYSTTNEEVDQDKIQKKPVAMLTVIEDSDGGTHDKLILMLFSPWDVGRTCALNFC